MTGAWKSIEIGGKRADVYEPAEIARARFGVLYLHGSDGETLREHAVFTQLLHELRFACVCPHGKRSWWGDRLCAEFDPTLGPERYLLREALPFFREHWGLSPRAIALLGAGMGGQGALRLSFKYPDLFPAVAGLAPAIDYHELHGEGTALDEMYDSKEQCRQDTALMHIHPSGFPPHIFFCVDPTDLRWYRGNDRLHEKLNALGIPHEIDFTTQAGGHCWDYYNHMAGRALRFLFAGLEHESRRLL